MPGGAWLAGASLSRLWFPGTDQGPPCVQFREIRPALLGCGWPSKPRSSSLPFPGETWPHRPWPPGPLAIEPAQPAALSCDPRACRARPGLGLACASCAQWASAGRAPAAVPKASLSSGRCCQASLPSRGEEPCAGQGQCLRLLPDPSPRTAAQEPSVNECLMSKEYLFVIGSSRSDPVFMKQVFCEMQPLLSLGSSCLAEALEEGVRPGPQTFPAWGQQTTLREAPCPSRGLAAIRASSPCTGTQGGGSSLSDLSCVALAHQLSSPGQAVLTLHLHQRERKWAGLRAGSWIPPPLCLTQLPGPRLLALSGSRAASGLCATPVHCQAFPPCPALPTPLLKAGGME